jgi:S-adenosylmethionine:tRNA ribosyltransferase-isomerase
VPDGLALGVGRRKVLDGRDDARRVLRVASLEPLQPSVDASPSRADQIDEKREIVHPGMAFREDLALESLEPPDRLIEQATDLRDLAGDGEDLGAHPVADRSSDLVRNRRFELRGGRRERGDLVPRALERRFDKRRFRAARGGIGDALLGSIESDFVHGRRTTLQRPVDTALLDYELPAELIAQRPAEPRDSSRLLVYRQRSGEIEHRVFSDLPDLLSGELVVVNDTRVVAGRLRLRRASGGAVEVVLTEEIDGEGAWEALVRPSRRLRAGERLGPVELVEPLGDGRWLVRLQGAPEGDPPLPPYIHTPLDDPDRYQTVYAREPGSAAAPTAGLHLTPRLLARLDPVAVTLHVGVDTFRPVVSPTLEGHEIHGERYRVDAGSWARIADAARVLAVGTTTVRVIETVAGTGELSGRTKLYITPGFAFQRVDALLTNFHLPRSTLLALVMAFAGLEETRRLYRIAIAERYRFYSFGDAMLVL